MPNSKKFLKFYKKNEHKFILNEIFEQISKKKKHSWNQEFHYFILIIRNRKQMILKRQISKIHKE